MRSHHPLIWIAVLLVVAWLVFRVALAITSGLLHLLWFAAILFAIGWAYRQLRKPRTPRG